MRNVTPIRPDLPDSPDLKKQLEALAEEMQQEVATLVTVEMALDSSYDPYPGLDSDNSTAQAALRGSRERLEDLIDRLEVLGLGRQP